MVLGFLLELKTIWIPGDGATLPDVQLNVFPIANPCKHRNLGEYHMGKILCQDFQRISSELLHQEASFVIPQYLELKNQQKELSLIYWKIQ